ncbi:MAG: Gfo/Idh/MocA family oxidoreductase, partial [Gemmatimonadota bacterium]|nr:Gfo/Idh/MocA family oxidoreductase [Gemmatimonadota bacterium]
MSRIRAAVIGVGRLGGEHARLLATSERFELTGVHDTDGGRAREIAERLGVRAFDDPDDLYAEVDAAVIAVPTGAHATVASRALDHDCHVLVEKPLAASLEDADALIARAEARGRVLGVGHSERFNGLLLAVQGLLDGPRFIESLRMAPFQPRGTDVNVVLDLMIHDIDLVLALVDAPLRDLHAVGVSVLSDSLDIANARLVFETGTAANITASRVTPKPLRQLRLFQPSGYFSLDLAHGLGEIGGPPEGDDAG